MSQSQEEKDRLKKAVFDGMSPRRQKSVLKRGYENWDPFLEPKDPIDIRKDPTKRTTQQLVREFLQQKEGDASPAYSSGVLEVALGLINNDDRALGMFEFSVWYQDLLRKQGLA